LLGFLIGIRSLFALQQLRHCDFAVAWERYDAHLGLRCRSLTAGYSPVPLNSPIIPNLASTKPCSVHYVSQAVLVPPGTRRSRIEDLRRNSQSLSGLADGHL